MGKKYYPIKQSGHTFIPITPIDRHSPHPVHIYKGVLEEGKDVSGDSCVGSFKGIVCKDGEGFYLDFNKERWRFHKGEDGQWYAKCLPPGQKEW